MLHKFLHLTFYPNIECELCMDFSLVLECTGVHTSFGTRACSLQP